MSDGSSSSSMAMYLHIQIKFLIPGSRFPIVHEVTVFLATHICLASSCCSTLCLLSLALSHSPKCLYFIVVFL